MSRVLVTGGSGYFGSLLADRLVGEGIEVLNFDLNSSDNKRIQTFIGDVRDFSAINQVMKNVDCVYHNVAQVPLAKNSKLFREVNIVGTKNVLEAALQNQVERVVYTSSSAVYGIPKSNPVSEETDPSPRESYGSAKLMGENLCAEYSREGLEVSIIRPRTIMGHGRLGIFQILFDWIENGFNIPVLGNGENIYQFVHSDDLAKACILAGASTKVGAYNCGASEYGSMRAVLESLCKHANTGSKVVSVPAWPAEISMKITSALGLSPLGAYHSLMYGQSMYFDCEKANRDLGWSPKYSNNQMFIESYDWYLNNKDLLKKKGSPHQSVIKQGVLSIIKNLI